MEEVIEGGHFVESVVFARVDPATIIAHHERFGPVPSVMAVGSYEAAVEVVKGCPLRTGLIQGRRTR